MEIKLLPGEEVKDVVGYEGLYKVLLISELFDLQFSDYFEQSV